MYVVCPEVQVGVEEEEEEEEEEGAWRGALVMMRFDEEKALEVLDGCGGVFAEAELLDCR